MDENLTEGKAVLLRQFTRDGDADAFASIVRSYGNMVYATGLRITGDAHHAADVTQETFFHLLQNAGRITGSLGGWLHQVATRRAIDIVRRDHSRRRREEAYATLKAVETDSWADISPVVDEALSELNESSRDLILRHFLEGKTMVQIAAEDGVSQPTVSRRVEQALQSLRERLRLKGVSVAVGVLGGMLASSTASAMPAPVLMELGKMNALSTGASKAAAGTALGALKVKVAAIAITVAAGAIGYVGYQSIGPDPAPSRAVVAAPAPRPGTRVPLVAMDPSPQRANPVGTNKSPAATARPRVRP
jgi:RNA polymerase sigma factor (sigma-70 family)